ncbi:hypothetical protein [Terrarubrum flagellatum]|uniref:hypothetical protein n=1 Tax=Terrirubrum flagellatum TaxID=2895980 RepID=UPI003144F6FD
MIVMGGMMTDVGSPPPPTVARSAPGVIEPLDVFAANDDRAYLMKVSEDAAAKLRLQSKIQKYAKRKADWDGDDGIPPSANAVRDALAFLDYAEIEFSIPSAVYAPGDGEVMFQWRNADAFIEVGFYGDNTISWYFRGAKGGVDHADDQFSRDQMEIPPRLSAYLEAL